METLHHLSSEMETPPHPSSHAAPLDHPSSQLEVLLDDSATLNQGSINKGINNNLEKK